MTHAEIVNECEASGLTVRQCAAYVTNVRAYTATHAKPGIQICWSLSLEGGLLGLPRVIVGGRETHARSIKEIRFLVDRAFLANGVIIDVQNK